MQENLEPVMCRELFVVVRRLSVNTINNHLEIKTVKGVKRSVDRTSESDTDDSTSTLKLKKYQLFEEEKRLKMGKTLEKLKEIADPDSDSDEHSAPKPLRLLQRFGKKSVNLGTSDIKKKNFVQKENQQSKGPEKPTKCPKKIITKRPFQLKQLSENKNLAICTMKSPNSTQQLEVSRLKHSDLGSQNNLSSNKNDDCFTYGNLEMTGKRQQESSSTLFNIVYPQNRENSGIGFYIPIETVTSPRCSVTPSDLGLIQLQEESDNSIVSQPKVFKDTGTALSKKYLKKAIVEPNISINNAAVCRDSTPLHQQLKSILVDPSKHKSTKTKFVTFASDTYNKAFEFNAYSNLLLRDEVIKRFLKWDAGAVFFDLSNGNHDVCHLLEEIVGSITDLILEFPPRPWDFLKLVDSWTNGAINLYRMLLSDHQASYRENDLLLLKKLDLKTSTEPEYFGFVLSSEKCNNQPITSVLFLSMHFRNFKKNDFLHAKVIGNLQDMLEHLSKFQ